MALVYVAPDKSVRLLASGSLFRIADVGFVVTAAHAIRDAHLYDRMIGISNASNGFVATPGTWITPAETQGADQHEESFDVAVYRLSPEMMSGLEGMHFLRVTDVMFEEPSTTGMYTLFGFPGIWAQPSRSPDEALLVKPFQFTCYAFQGGAGDLGDYDPRYHIVLDATAEAVTHADGSAVSLHHRDGRVGRFPNDLKGISGCPVWRIGDFTEPVADWGRTPPAIVGVENRAYKELRLLRATRWIAVTTLIHEAFPDLRPAIDVWHATFSR